MGSILASAIISNARGILLDPDADWFTDAELLGWLNFAERKVLLVRPELYPVRAAMTLAAGISQILPAAAIALLDIYTNVASKRRAILTSREMLEQNNNFWPAATQAVEVEHWTHDPRSKVMFEVYPPNTGTGQLNVLYGGVPAPIPSVAGTININDVYEAPLLYYLLAEAFSANSVKQDLTKATFYNSQANTLLGVNAQTGIALAPKLGAPGGS